jgi:hypothetical protein
MTGLSAVPQGCLYFSVHIVKHSVRVPLVAGPVRVRIY